MIHFNGQVSKSVMLCSPSCFPTQQSAATFGTTDAATITNVALIAHFMMSKKGGLSGRCSQKIKIEGLTPALLLTDQQFCRQGTNCSENRTPRSASNHLETFLRPPPSLLRKLLLERQRRAHRNRSFSKATGKFKEHYHGEDMKRNRSGRANFKGGRLPSFVEGKAGSFARSPSIRRSAKSLRRNAGGGSGSWSKGSEQELEQSMEQQQSLRGISAGTTSMWVLRQRKSHRGRPLCNSTTVHRSSSLPLPVLQKFVSQIDPHTVDGRNALLRLSQAYLCTVSLFAIAAFKKLTEQLNLLQ